MCWLSTAARLYYRSLTDAFHTISSGIPPNYVSSAWREHHFASQGPILIWFLGCLGCLCLCFPARRPPLCGSPVGDIVNGGEWNPWLSGRPLSHDTGVACCCSEYSSSDWVGLRDQIYTQISELLSILSIGFPRQRPLCFSLLVAMGILRFCPGDFAAAWYDPTQGFQACFLEAQDQQVRVIVVGSCIARCWKTLKLRKLELPKLHYSLFKSLVLMDSTAKLQQVSFLCATHSLCIPSGPSIKRQNGFFHWRQRNFLSFQCFSMSFCFFWLIELNGLESSACHFTSWTVCWCASSLPWSPSSQLSGWGPLRWRSAVGFGGSDHQVCCLPDQWAPWDIMWHRSIQLGCVTCLDVSGFHCSTRPTLHCR